jgi:hypothetical protein
MNDECRLSRNKPKPNTCATSNQRSLTFFLDRMLGLQWSHIKCLRGIRDESAELYGCSGKDKLMDIDIEGWRC